MTTRGRAGQWISDRFLVLALGVGLAAWTGCEATAPVGQAGDDITDVTQSKVKDQSIGNCWVYATASWVESMNKAATGVEADVSESYWTYWNWFDTLTKGDQTGTELETGGNHYDAVSLIQRFGVMSEGDFIPEEADSQASQRQSSALAAINTMMKDGVLKDPAVRSDKKIVREALDQAWQLTPEVRAELTLVFGEFYSRDLTTRLPGQNKLAADTTGTHVVRASDFAARYSRNDGKPASDHTLAEAVAQWKYTSYPSSSNVTGRRSFQQRFQRALHDSQPILMSWFVDFKAMDREGRFLKPPETPGTAHDQGGHMTVMEDYEATDVPGYGTLPAGVLETRPEALAAALDPAAKISFIRIKNSWGDYRSVAGFPDKGYHDLYMEYLDADLKTCTEADPAKPEEPVTCDGSKQALRAVVLPPGY